MKKLVVGITKKSWLERLPAKEADEFLTLVDSIVVVTDEDVDNEPPYFYVKGEYRDIFNLLQSLACCKAYPQKTLFTVNFCVVELTETTTPETLREAWLDELRVYKLV